MHNIFIQYTTTTKKGIHLCLSLTFQHVIKYYYSSFSAPNKLETLYHRTWHRHRHNFASISIFITPFLRLYRPCVCKCLVWLHWSWSEFGKSWQTNYLSNVKKDIYLIFFIEWSCLVLFLLCIGSGEETVAPFNFLY